LKGALSPHIKDYSMEVKYENADEGYEMVESATESLKGLDTSLKSSQSKLKKKVILLFDKSAEVDDKIDSGAGKYDHLPPIVTPKLLQAPHKIPPLYPFNRTTVYLLMSADSCQHAPKAVVLRATSEHGPLELEIPVQDVGIGQTIHQLATRKAVVELEEGRGWITEASDGDGKVIKKKYEGRWDEMVEREAVRLGVQFQVANKWCSFVAVEENADTEDLPDYEMIDKGGVEGYTTQLPRSQAQGRTSADKKSYVSFARSSSPSRAQPQGFHGLSAMAAGGYAPSAPTPSARLGRGFAARSMKVLDTSKIRRQLASTAAPPSAPRGPSSFGISQASRKRSAVPVPMSQPQKSDMSADAVEADESSEDAAMDDVYSTPTMSRSASEPETAAPPMTNEEKMLELVSLQSFDGSWQMTNKFLLILGLNEAMLTALLQLEDTVVATLVAVGFLECKVPEEEGVWEMIVEKAKGWLDGKIGENSAAEGLAKVKKYVY
jgi:hypothetical protein